MEEKKQSKWEREERKRKKHNSRETSLFKSETETVSFKGKCKLKTTAELN